MNNAHQNAEEISIAECNVYKFIVRQDGCIKKTNTRCLEVSRVEMYRGNPLKIALLANWDTRIKLSTHGSGKVADTYDLILIVKKIAYQSFEVQPLELRLSEGSIVEVKTINVDVGSLH